MHGATVEDYVKAIYKLQDGSDAVSTSALAEKMGISAAAATKMLKQLASLKLVTYTPYYGARLTDVGVKVALEVIRHHRLIELYLTEAMGYTWDQVDAEAEKLEHHISEEFEDRIAEMLDHPEVDPHGDPIPTRDGVIAPLRGEPLAEAAAGDTVIVRRVRDGNPEVLRYLTGIGIGLNTIVKITERMPFNGPLTLEIAERTHAVGRELAGHVFVEPYEEKLRKA